MRSLVYTITVIVLIIAGIKGCTEIQHDFEATLGQEVSLAPGQSVLLADEVMKIEFIDVTEDSRCPRDVNCIQAGRAICSVKITLKGKETASNLTERGLTTTPTDAAFGKYVLSFTLNPYPVSTVTISDDDYRLALVCRLGQAQ